MKDSDGKKKDIFISPYMRYKCVIPMVVHHEMKERERQQKEEEKHSTINNGEEHIDETEINESKGRVYEHFKQISQTVNTTLETPKKKKKKKTCKPLSLSEMKGKKRKRESDIKNEIQRKSNNDDFSASPSSSLDVANTCKRVKWEEQEKQKAQDNNSEIIKSIR